MLKTIIILFFVGTSATAYANFNASGNAVLPRTNMEIVDSLLATSCHEAVLFTKSYSPTVVHARVESREAESLILAKLVRAAEGAFPISQAADKADTRLEFSAREIKVTYTTDSTDSDSIWRTVCLGVSALVSDHNGILHTFAPTPMLVTDRISRTDVASIQSGDYRFCRSELPEKPVSFLDSVAAPAIAVCATLVSLVLLFTVRSR